MSPHDAANRELIDLLFAELSLHPLLRQESEEQAQQKATRPDEEQLALCTGQLQVEAVLDGEFVNV